MGRSTCDKSRLGQRYQLGGHPKKSGHEGWLGGKKLVMENSGTDKITRGQNLEQENRVQGRS